MRIGLATDFYFPWIGGPSILIRNLAQGLSGRGHDVSLLAPSATGPATTEREGEVCVRRVRTVPAPVGHELRLSLAVVRDAGHWLDATRPDVVHVHHPFPIGAATVFAARRRGIPVVMTNHTIPECSLWGIRSTPFLYPLAIQGFGSWISFLLRRCTAVATPTATAAAALPSLGYNGAVSVISNGIDTGKFHPGEPDSALRQRLGFDERPIVLYTGRLDAEKQMETWVRAAALLADLDVQFAIGGKGSDRESLEALVRRLGIAVKTKFFGYVDLAELPDLYRLASVYFITSPVELQSISTLEAVASGLPVVAADAMALPELVTDGSNGYLFPTGDADGAAQALRGVLTNPGRAATMGQEGRTLAARHSLDITIQAYEHLLSDARASMNRVGHFERAAAAG